MDKMKPILILPPDTMSAEDIKKLENNWLCVVVAKDPALVKFVDPIPSVVQRTKIEDAAIKLSRKLLAGQIRSDNYGAVSRVDLLNFYIRYLTEGTPLDPDPPEEIEENYFKEEKRLELQRLARAEAKAEREKRKAEATKTVAPKKGS